MCDLTRILWLADDSVYWLKPQLSLSKASQSFTRRCCSHLNFLAEDKRHYDGAERFLRGLGQHSITLCLEVTFYEMYAECGLLRLQRNCWNFIGTVKVKWGYSSITRKHFDVCTFLSSVYELGSFLLTRHVLWRREHHSAASWWLIAQLQISLHPMPNRAATH